MLNKLKKIWEPVSHIKIRTKLFLLILLTGSLCLTLFRFLWHKKWDTYYFLAENLPIDQSFFPMPADNFWIKLDEEASKHDFPESENDTKAIKELEPFFSLADEYTSISIYGLEDGLYRAGRYPESMLWDEPFSTFFRFTYRWIDEDVDQIYTRAIQFKNGYANVIISFYHSSFFVVPYAIFCLILCIFLFFSVILFFIGRKLKTVVRLEKNILQLSSGDLITPIPNSGYDELGILALELDKLRLTLHENIQTEQKLHKSNQELIAALSHDLRTPLTILKGYLEIVRLNQNPDMREEYVNRCLQKTEDIQEMTNRMFEYALVYDAADTVKDLQLAKVSLAFFLDSLKEHADFLHLAGFETEFHIFSSLPKSTVPFSDSLCITADLAMVKRVLNNLFSNIIKYADKKDAVFISASVGPALTILLKNRIHNQQNDIESTQIGLKSACKIMEQMDCMLTTQSKEDYFTATLNFPIHNEPDIHETT